VQNFEAKRYPANITSGATTVSGLITNTKYALSPTNATSETLDFDSMSLLQTYNWSTGLPLDQNGSTANTNLDLSKANITSSKIYNLTNAGSKAVNPGASYHAASLVSCMECHGGEEPLGHYTRVADNAGPTAASKICSDCHYGGGGKEANGSQWRQLEAGGFGLTGKNNDTGAVEAHKAWVNNDVGVGRFDGPVGAANNDACIACHTHVAIDINFKKGYKLELNADESPTGDYIVSNSAVKGTVAISVYGNSEGTTFATSDKNITWTPTETLYINGTGAQVLGLNNDATDNETALTT
jgi:hypothetical protein